MTNQTPDETIEQEKRFLSEMDNYTTRSGRIVKRTVDIKKKNPMLIPSFHID